jgi:hypothetical protein
VGTKSVSAILGLRASSRVALGELAEFLAEESGVGEGFCLTVMAVKFEAARLLCRKQKVYGPHNINATGLVGIAVQMMNKAGRLLTMGARLVLGLPPSEDAEVATPRDCTLDDENYGTIGTMWLDGTWPGSPAGVAAKEAV